MADIKSAPATNANAQPAVAVKYYSGAYVSGLLKNTDDNRMVLVHSWVTFQSSSLYAFTKHKIFHKAKQDLAKHDWSANVTWKHLCYTPPLLDDPKAHQDIKGGREFTYTVQYCCVLTRVYHTLTFLSQNQNAAANPEQFFPRIESAVKQLGQEPLTIVLTCITRSEHAQ